MVPAEEGRHDNFEVAQRFLRTAVVVDDEAYILGCNDGPKAPVIAPNRHLIKSSKEDQSPSGGGSNYSLNAQSIMDSFSELGVICGVVSPEKSEMEAMRKADIVVLDWKLRDEKSEYTLSLLDELLAGGSERSSLRLVAIYTGEATLEEIRKDLFSELKKKRHAPTNDNNQMTIKYRHGRLVLYAKASVNLAKPLKQRAVAETELPNRLVNDFAAMTEGLLPGIAITSLTAVRENEHKILDRFSAELDPAFLTHKTCLPNPEEAELQIVDHVSEELRGLMDEAVARKNPAVKQALEKCLQHDGRNEFEFCEKRLTLDETVDMVTKGIEKNKLLRKRCFLSKGFSGSGDNYLDEKLAWIMSFRTVYDKPPPTLWLGSVVTMKETDEEKYLLCMSPRCSSVRLKNETKFIFLPLVEQGKDDLQIVTKTGENFKRLGVKLDPSKWCLHRFVPNECGRVIAKKLDAERRNQFEFTDICDCKFVWQGELKADHAQRIAQNIATNLSRVAVVESEWLRLMAKK